MRSVRTVYPAAAPHWVGDGFFVRQLFSHMGEDRGTSPFLMLDYAAPHRFAPGEAQSPRGVGAHPHKGFETVTIAYQGEVAHRDSSGGGGVIQAGDVQWMTAGAGIIHEEFHADSFTQRGGMFEMVQLWVNLPAAHKNAPPAYQHLAKAGIPVVRLPEDAGYVRVIAGLHRGIRGAAKTFTELNVWDVVLDANRTASFDVPETHNLVMVVLRGEAVFNGKDRARPGELVRFAQEAGDVRISAGAEEVNILLLSGVPIDEPVVGYGPFVLNSKEEIRQAVLDYQSGRFGQLSSS